VAANGRVEHRAIIGAPPWLAGLARAAADVATVYLAFRLAYWLRYSVELGGHVPAASQQPFSFFRNVILLCMTLVVIVFQIRGVYRQPRWTTWLDEASAIATAVTICIAIVLMYAFLQRFYPSRLIFLYAYLLIIGLLVLVRGVVRLVREQLWVRGIGVDRVLVVGAGQAGQRLLQWLLGQPQLGYQVVGFVDDQPPPANWGIATQRRVEKPLHLGTSSDISAIVRMQRIDEVIIALPPTAHAQMIAIMDQCRAHDIEFKLVPDLFELTMDRVHIHEVAGLPLIGLRQARIAGWNFVVKRGLDMAAAAIVLTVCSIPFALLAIAIKLDSPGPVFFRQTRVGRNSRLFTCYKFRSMVVDAEEQQRQLVDALNGDPRHPKDPNDPRRTRVGKFLRRTSLDELPQFVNILLGEMSVVGPRPPVPAEVALYDDWHRERLRVTPGLTGLWQVNGRSDVGFDEMVRLDLYYAEHWSPWLDFKIIMRTVPAILTSRGAY
jgi:exopolysaccharide biosynthesis polyprenyl glycosylphosphotransferase